ncbi:MAG: dTDP-4-dehydrorhamnose 3,5-epimerase family protein [Patescibacteria group bacterium]|jgi:dTDP-4-dehydrorhamnose 3,5-epimerase|nr:dTDP-4-dehydrorhamnose 3,5-epimerase family protein [Patescibacteria group bacterium]
MIKDVVITNLEKFHDNRGWLAEIFRNDQSEFRPAMGYVSQTLPGVVRGPHEHQEQSDFFVFLFGTFRLYLWDNREGSANYRQLETYEVGENNPAGVIIPPGVVHAYKCISENPGLVINLPNELYRGNNKADAVDEIRWEDDQSSPFVVE